MWKTSTVHGFMGIGESGSSSLRWMKWKLGRRLYMQARGEAHRNLPATSGEVYVQLGLVQISNSIEDVVVFDVGANRGQWTSQLLSLLSGRDVGSRPIKIYAFEPAPASRLSFSDRIGSLEGSEQVDLLPLALSDMPGKAEFAIWSDTAGTNTLAFEGKRRADAKDVLNVDVETIDNVIGDKGLSRVHLIKIDAEGSDARVIFGAENALNQELIDVVQFEYNGRWIYSRNYLKDVFDVLDGTPYLIGKVRSDCIELYDSWHPELERFFEANYLLIHPRAVDWYRVKKGSIGKDNTFIQTDSN